MPPKNSISVKLGLDLTTFRKNVNEGTAKIRLFGRSIKESLTTAGGQNFTVFSTGFAAAGAAASAAAIGGVYLFITRMTEAIGKASEFSKATFQMQSSIDAANRQFQVGSSKQWEQNIKDLSASLRIYSETDLRNAASRTVDMTKRLGLSGKEMKKVIEISGELGAGKFGLVDSVERVTAALRGEAEASEALGLTLNEDYVKGVYAAGKATGKAWKDLTDLEKAQIRYNILLDQANPKLGQAAKSLSIYDGQLAATANAYDDVQKEAGGLVTQNTFVIEGLKILKETFKTLRAEIAGNREEYVSLVKNGILLVIDGIGSAIEITRFFYNGWQGLQLVAHGAIVVIVKGLEMVVGALRTVLKPMDLFLTGLAKIGIIDSNPLKDLEETLQGFGKFSLDEYNAMLDKVSDTNAKFDQAKAVVEQFKQKIASIPAEYKAATDSMESDTKKVEKEIKLVDGVWTDVAKKSGKEWSSMANGMIKDIERVKHAARRVTIGADGKTESTEYSASGFASGGYHSGGFRIVGERGPELEYTGPSRIFNNSSTRAIVNAISMISPGVLRGPAGSSAQTYNHNITLNYSGGGSRSDANHIASVVLNELQRRYRRASS